MSAFKLLTRSSDPSTPIPSSAFPALDCATSLPTILAAAQVIAADTTQSHFDRIVSRVARDAAFEMTETDAIAWGVNYFSSDGIGEREAIEAAADSDEGLLGTGPDPLTSFAEIRLRSDLPNRLSSTRVCAVTEPLLSLIRAGNPPPDSAFALPIDWNQFISDTSVASDFGDNGIPIHTDPSFQLSSATGPCPGRYRFAHTAINAHVIKNHRKRFCAIFRRARLRHCHVMNLGLAPKYGKAQGRLTNDASGTAARGSYFRRCTRSNKSPVLTPLNTAWVAEEATRRWGAIHHPTLRDIVRTVLRAIALHGRQNVVLFKDDLNGFYQLASFRPCDVHKMVFQLFHPPSDRDCQWFMVSLAGNFGWAALPMAMEVITRILRACIGYLIFGFMLMYVDDIIIVTSKDAFASDRAHAITTITTLLGPDAHAVDKFESTYDPSIPSVSRPIDILGWTLDLDTLLVSVAYKNQVRALHWFLEADIDSKYDLTTRERLCSLAERYSAVFTELRVLMPAMYSMLGGKSRMHRGARVPLPPQARLAVSLWRAYMLAAEADRDAGRSFGRPFHFFGELPPRGILEFDGSLDGIGWRLFDSTSQSWIAVAFMVPPPTHLQARDSSYQNTMELSALAMGLAHAVTLGWKHSAIHIRGDSRSVLHWAASTNFRSQLAVGAAALLMATCSAADLHIADATWISSDDNAICDSLSRGRPDDLRARGFIDVPPADLTFAHPFQGLLALCSPTNVPTTPTDFVTLWSNLQVMLPAPWFPEPPSSPH